MENVGSGKGRSEGTKIWREVREAGQGGRGRGKVYLGRKGCIQSGAVSGFLPGGGRDIFRGGINLPGGGEKIARYLFSPQLSYTTSLIYDHFF